MPIHQTTSYLFESTDKAANLFALAELGNIYTRIMNPTNAVLEERMAAIDGGAAGLAVSSGQTASAYSIQNLARAGDNIVSSSHLYGGTYNQFKNNLSEMGIEVRFVDPTDPETLRKPQMKILELILVKPYQILDFKFFRSKKSQKLEDL